MKAGVLFSGGKDSTYAAFLARTMGLPQVTVGTQGVKEEELADLRKALQIMKRDYSVEAVYTGALASVYQKSRVERICDEVGVKAVSPLWHVDPVAHLTNLLENRFEVIITGVAALGLDESWLGRTLDATMVRDLAKLNAKYGLHPGLEGGEGETFVLDCPLFERRIEVASSKKHWEGDAGHLEILDARLVAKT
jgi:ABC transporter with metal-binding/Fe-S-binding domain ATP-binding protein